MRIGIVTEEYPPAAGPLADHVHQFAREARRLGHTVKVLTGAVPDLVRAPPAGAPSRAGGKATSTAAPSPAREPDVLRLARSRPLLGAGALRRVSGGPSAPAALQSALARERFDVVHVHEPLSPVLPLLAVHHAAGPVVGTFHEPFRPGLVGRLLRGTLQRHLDRLDAVVATSKASAASLPERVRGDLRLIPPGVDVDRLARGCRIRRFQDGRLNVLCAGAVEPRGNLEVLYAAAQRVWRAVELRLIVLGGGPLVARYRALVPRGMENDVVFAEPTAEALPDYLASADVCCAVAATPRPLLEAMAAGRPVLAADVEAHREILQHGREGELLPLTDAGAWARALVRLGREPARGAAYGERGRNAVQRYAWPGVAREILNLYRSIGVRG
ncbi:MAG TPA: glycosyltransferase family 4 protein [Anaeromyxobacter sp.]|nr:glycosyltransferase family 4 protein [Anaeromyxobacter sp.]